METWVRIPPVTPHHVGRRRPIRVVKFEARGGLAELVRACGRWRVGADAENVYKGTLRPPLAEAAGVVIAAELRAGAAGASGPARHHDTPRRDHPLRPEKVRRVEKERGLIIGKVDGHKKARSLLLRTAVTFIGALPGVAVLVGTMNKDSRRGLPTGVHVAALPTVFAGAVTLAAQGAFHQTCVATRQWLDQLLPWVLEHPHAVRAEHIDRLLSGGPG